MLIHHLRVWRQFWLVAFMRQSAFRANFYLSLFEGFAQVVLVMATFAIIYQFTPDIAGWTQAQVLIVVGLYRMVDGFVNAQIAPNMREIDKYVQTGELDLLLLRPVESQFLVSTRLVALPELINIPIGVALVIYAGLQADVLWSVSGLLLALLLLLCGTVMIYAVWFMMMALALWFTWSPFESMVGTLFSIGRYPVDFFQRQVRAVLTFIIPVAFATSFPAEALLGRLDPKLILIAPLFALTLLILSQRFWRWGLRSYGSASS